MAVIFIRPKDTIYVKKPIQECLGIEGGTLHMGSKGTVIMSYVDTERSGKTIVKCLFDDGIADVCLEDISMFKPSLAMSIFVSGPDPTGEYMFSILCSKQEAILSYEAKYQTAPATVREFVISNHFDINTLKSLAKMGLSPAYAL